MPQQQAGYPAVGEGVPVDSVAGAVLQGEAEVVVEVQHVQLVGVGQGAAVEVGLDHVVAQQGSLVLNLEGKEDSSGKERECEKGK